MATPTQTQENKEKAASVLRRLSTVPFVGYVKGKVERLGEKTVRIVAKKGLTLGLGYLYPGSQFLVPIGADVFIEITKETPALIKGEIGGREFGSKIVGRFSTSVKEQAGEIASSYFGGGFLQRFAGRVTGRIVGDQFTGMLTGFGTRAWSSARDRLTPKETAEDVVRNAVAREEKKERKTFSPKQQLDYINRNRSKLVAGAVIGGVAAVAAAYHISDGQSVFREGLQFVAAAQVGASVTSAVISDTVAVPVRKVRSIVEDYSNLAMAPKGTDAKTGERAPSTLNLESRNRVQKAVAEAVVEEMTASHLLRSAVARIAKETLDVAESQAIGATTQGIVTAAGSLWKDGAAEEAKEELKEFKDKTSALSDLAKANAVAMLKFAALVKESKGRPLDIEKAMGDVSDSVKAALEDPSFRVDWGRVERLKTNLENLKEIAFQKAHRVSKEASDVERAKETLTDTQIQRKEAETFRSALLKQIPVPQELMEMKTNAELAKNIKQGLDTIRGFDTSGILHTKIGSDGKLEKRQYTSVAGYAIQAAAESALTGGIGVVGQAARAAQKAAAVSRTAGVVRQGMDLAAGAAQVARTASQIIGSAEDGLEFAADLEEDIDTLQTASGLASKVERLTDPFRFARGAASMLGVGESYDKVVNGVSGAYNNLTGFEADQLDVIIDLMGAVGNQSLGGLLPTRGQTLAKLGAGDMLSHFLGLQQSRTKRNLARFAVGSVIGNNRVEDCQNQVDAAQQSLEKEAREADDARRELRFAQREVKETEERVSKEQAFLRTVHDRAVKRAERYGAEAKALEDDIAEREARLSVNAAAQAEAKKAAKQIAIQQGVDQTIQALNRQLAENEDKIRALLEEKRKKEEEAKLRLEVKKRTAIASLNTRDRRQRTLASLRAKESEAKGGVIPKENIRSSSEDGPFEDVMRESYVLPPLSERAQVGADRVALRMPKPTLANEARAAVNSDKDSKLLKVPVAHSRSSYGESAGRLRPRATAPELIDAEKKAVNPPGADVTIGTSNSNFKEDDRKGYYQNLGDRQNPRPREPVYGGSTVNAAGELFDGGGSERGMLAPNRHGSDVRNAARNEEKARDAAEKSREHAEDAKESYVSMVAEKAKNILSASASAVLVAKDNVSTAFEYARLAKDAAVGAANSRAVTGMLYALSGAASLSGRALGALGSGMYYSARYLASGGYTTFQRQLYSEHKQLGFPDTENGWRRFARTLDIRSKQLASDAEATARAAQRQDSKTRKAAATEVSKTRAESEMYRAKARQAESFAQTHKARADAERVRREREAADAEALRQEAKAREVAEVRAPPYRFSVDVKAPEGKIELKPATRRQLDALTRKYGAIGTKKATSNMMRVVLNTMTKNQLQVMFPEMAGVGTKVAMIGNPFTQGEIWKRYYASAITFEGRDTTPEYKYQRDKSVLSVVDMLYRLQAIAGISLDPFAPFIESYRSLVREHPDLRWVR